MDFEKSRQIKNKIDFFITARKKYITNIIIFIKFSVRSDHRAVRRTVKINIKNMRAKMIRAKKKTTK